MAIPELGSYKKIMMRNNWNKFFALVFLVAACTAKVNQEAPSPNRSPSVPIPSVELTEPVNQPIVLTPTETLSKFQILHNSVKETKSVELTEIKKNKRYQSNGFSTDTNSNPKCDRYINTQTNKDTDINPKPIFYNYILSNICV